MVLFSLEEIDVTGLRTFSNNRDVLRDLFVYLEYVRERSIKRMTRTNEIPSADQNKLARLLGGLSTQRENEMEASEAAQWIDFIDHLAYRLQLVSFDIKGEYRGATSNEPSFINNYMSVIESNFRAFLALSPIKQERRILETLRKPQKVDVFGWEAPSEFYKTGVLGQLEPFSPRGSAVGVNPFIDYPQARQYLLDLLASLSPGAWFSTESLIQYVKYNQPFFLIPEKLPKDRWGNTVKRYDYFYETEGRWGYEKDAVSAGAPDAFERVEGRYIERFLENIPLIMRFVDVAHDPAPYLGIYPPRGMLKAFRVSERMGRLLHGQGVEPRVTVQPNFDVVIESDYYPAHVIRQIAALGEQVSSPMLGTAYVAIFQLKKARVAEALVRKPDLDVPALLKDLSGRELPSNVQIELEEWSGHADQFMLYEGFALLESAETLPQAEKFAVERLSPQLSLVRDALRLFKTLEQAGWIPLSISHPPNAFYPLPQVVESIFPKAAPVETPLATVTPITVSCVVSVTVRFPDEAAFDAFRKMLAEQRCPFQSDAKILSITYEQANQAKFDEAIQKLSDKYTVTIV